MSNGKHPIKFSDPGALLTPNRLDIAIKLAFLRQKLSAGSYGYNVYTSHLQAFGLGQIREPGNPDKNSIHAFVQDFQNIASDIKISEFDFQRSPIPVTKSGSINNGSHRTAAAIFANKQVLTIEVEQEPDEYDYKFFKRRGMSIQELDFAVLTYLEYAKDPRVALIWPKGNAYNLDETNFFSDIIYAKNIKVTDALLKELVFLAYDGETWLGKPNSRYAGADQKAALISHKKQLMRLVFFEASSHQNVVRQKDDFRKNSTSDKHAIHITDDKNETLALAKTLLNKNTLDFLSSKRPHETPSFINLVKNLKTNNWDNDNFVIAGSGPLAAFGLRDCSDLDYLTVDVDLGLSHLNINSHDNERHWYPISAKDIIEHPQNYFYYQGIKFVNLDIIRHMKENRREAKDIIDLRLINSVPKSTFTVRHQLTKSLRIKSYFFIIRMKLKVTSYLFATLKVLGLYNAVRHIYRWAVSKT